MNHRPLYLTVTSMEHHVDEFDGFLTLFHSCLQTAIVGVGISPRT